MKHEYDAAGKAQQVKRYIAEKSITGKSNLHETYVSCFNAIDMADKWHSEVDEHHKMNLWKAKMKIAIDCFGILNCWGTFIKKEYKSWIDFQRVALQMITYEL